MGQKMDLAGRLSQLLIMILGVFIGLLWSA